MHYLIHKLMMFASVSKRIKLMQTAQKTQNWGIEQIIPFQEQRLREMICYCWEYVPFYRLHWQDHINSPEEIRSIADLQKLPILTKDQVRNHYDQLMTTELGVQSSEARSGGSTGQPMKFRLSPFEEELSWGLMYAGWYRAGYRVGYPFLVVGGESIGSGFGDKRNWRDFIVNRWVTSGSNLSRERVMALAETAYFKKIRFIYGYPNAIRELGEWLLTINESPPAQLAGIVCTAEVMLPEVRQRIKQLFGGVPVLDQWGLNDGGLQACESKEGEGFHVCYQRAILEIIDENGQQINQIGQAGHALATSLTNFAFPFVRYDTGDIVHWKTLAPKDSDVNWPCLGPIDGRTGDVIYLESGRSITMPGLTLVMRWLDGLRQYQFIQTGPNQVAARLDFGSETPLSEAETLAFLKEKIAQEIDWTVVFAPVELTKNGKLLIIRNDWLRAQGLTRPTTL